MKKRIAITLALLILLSIATVRAEETGSAEQTEPAESEAVVTESAEATTDETVFQTDEHAAETANPGEKDASSIALRLDVEKKAVCPDGKALAPSMTDDIVTIDTVNGVFTVVTAAGTRLSVTLPFGVYCITQDIVQQLDVYLSLYADVGAALNTYASQGIHMDLYDFCTGQSVYVAESGDIFAAITGNLSRLNLTDRKQVAAYLSGNRFGNYPSQFKRVGGNIYIAFDLAQDCGFVVYDTIVGGRLIEVYTVCESGREGMERIDRMISSLTFGQQSPEAGETASEETVPAETVTEETVPENTTETATEETVPENTAETAPEETTSE